MGKFLTTTRSQTLPKDMPDATETADKYADGTVFEADDGSRWRLRHARWQSAKTSKRKATAPRLVKARAS
ncbi:MAG: hypothetical protein WCC30_06470 [Candidatus Dormiibacterota bacterium]